jgi:LmbE family N-acetylglucosaminyl deacetylase
MRMWLVCVVALGACGDNSYLDGAPLAPAANLTIVAHQDDDLLFMQPDLIEAVQRGDGFTSVYVTAGNANTGLELSERRYAGLKQAYGMMAGSDAWFCGWITIDGHWVQHCRLEEPKVSLIFLGYPDGGVPGEVHNSLLRLWEGKVASATTVARREARHDRDSLVGVLARIIDETDPVTLRTLEIASTHGYDHSDHKMAGALALLATAQSSRSPELLSYRGYNNVEDPVNVDPAIYARALGPLLHYEACATRCGTCGIPCRAEDIARSHRDYLLHRYAIGVRRSATGQLRLDGGCVAVTGAGDNAAIVDCAQAPSWQLDEAGALRASNGLCLRVLLTGEIVGSACGELGPAGRFFLDDDGHLWTGSPPPPQADMTDAHLDCVTALGGRPRATLCGSGRSPTVELSRTMTPTARDTAAITRAGRAVRVARLPLDPQPMVCAIEPGAGLMCAPSAAGGGLRPAVRVDDPTAPLAIEPESLVLGDVDGDGATDACGRTAGGIACATAADGYRAAPWSQTLGGTGPATATDRSLAIAPGSEICGLGAEGVVCVARSSTAITDVRSTWPDRSAALWIANLDGDLDPDWCVAMPTGPACSLAADRGTTTDGVPWAYAFLGRVEGSAGDGALPDTASAVFTDVDGDGRDELCTVRDGAIACSRSQGHGFGPRSVVARLPPGMTPVSLWAEPARGAPVPRICAADATTIACTE